MRQQIAACRQAWRLFRSDSRAESVAAVVVVAAVVGPALIEARRSGRDSAHKSHHFQSKRGVGHDS